MIYKKYFRKTSLKQPGIGELFLEEVQKKNPKYFLEIGVFHGVTARNVCNLMFKNHNNDFKYIGIDLFEESKEHEDEVVPVYKFNNPIKNFYYKYIKRQNPYSIVAVNDLLSKYKKNIELIKGNTNLILKDLSIKNIDFIFIDGGHSYDTIQNDLFYSKKFLAKNGIILCDDYNLGNTNIKKSIDDFATNNKCSLDIIQERFAKIQFN